MVVGLPALGAIAKKLIEVFGGDKREGEQESKGEGKPGVPVSGRPPAHPVARPMPVRTMPRPDQHRRVARPFPHGESPAGTSEGPPAKAPPTTAASEGREVMAEIIEEIMPGLVGQLRPKTAPQPPARPERRPPPTSRMPPAPPHSRVQPAEGRQPKRVRKRAPVGEARPAKKTRSKKASPGLGFSDRLHLGTAYDEAPAGEVELVEGVAEGYDADSLRRQTRASLRRAIVMSEILGPPLALRAHSDQR